MRTMTHLAFAAIAASALALAGCGGGGSSSSTMVDPPAAPAAPEPTVPETPAPTAAAVTLPSDGNMYLDEMLTTLADTTAPVMLATGEMHEVGAYTLTCDAGPCEVTIADGEVSATGTVTAAYTATAMATIDAAKMTAMTENEGRTAGLYNALTDDPQIGRTILGTSAVTVSRGVSGNAKVTVEGGKAGWEASADAPMAISGWHGTVVNGITGSRKTQSFTVYTNVEAAKRRAFSKVYNATATGLTTGIAFVAADPSRTANPKEHITLTNVAIQTAGVSGWLDSSGFPAATASNEFTYNDADGEKRTKFSGTFRGASGTYECTTGAGCTVEVTAATTAEAASYTAAGDWTFTPAAGNAAQIVNPDADHMHFGWWVNTPTKAGVGGEFLYDAQVFAGGQALFVDAGNTAGSGAITSLTGEADYEGPAAGLYAVKADAENDVAAAHGDFMATAKLTANFGDNTAAGSVKGTIDAFQNGDGVDMSAWKLTLNALSIDNTGISTGGNIVSGADVLGNWQYQLYGPEENSDGVAQRPSGIAGVFRADIDKNTAVAGAFATE